jgi:hypothetical protein
LANNKDYYKEPKDGNEKRLKGQIKRLEHEVNRLKSELRTLEVALGKNIMFLKTKTKQYTVEELIQGAQDQMNLEQIGEDKDHTFDAITEKWKCYKCEVGLLKLIIVPGQRYFRKCTTKECTHRTEVKTLTEEVDLGV